MQAATLGDSSAWKLNNLLSVYPCVTDDSTITDGLRATTTLLIGEAYERLGNLAQAKNVYEDLLDDFPDVGDTLRAQWRIQFIDSFLSDTTYSSVFDSTMSAYTGRVLKDLMDAPYSGGMGKRRQFGLTEEEMAEMAGPEEELAIKLDQNSPNPFGSLTEIQYFLSTREHAKLTLIDIGGRVVANMIDRYVPGGWSTLIVNGSGLTPGIYLLRLESGGKAAMIKINKAE
jgi:hypothetical protein